MEKHAPGPQEQSPEVLPAHGAGRGQEDAAPCPQNLPPHQTLETCTEQKSSPPAC